jgi:dCTP deaminase
MRYGGALPDHLIRELLEGNFVQQASEDNIKPSSLDLIITDEIFRVSGAFMPNHDETVYEAIRQADGMKLAPDSILERGACYVARLSEHIHKLPGDTYGYANPKSSSGRLDVHVRLLADKVSGYDTVPPGYTGPLWVLIVPKKFPVIVRTGTSLNQLRFFNQDTRLDRLRMEMVFEQKGGLLCHRGGEMIRYNEIRHSNNDGSLILSLDLDLETPGFEALDTNEVIDLSLKGHYDPEFFFRPVTISKKNGLSSILLVSSTFYILSTKEYVRVPATFACEMAPMDARSGEFRSHYAGFIDPGWGIGSDGKLSGRPLTLEVRSFEGLMVRDGQRIARVKYERLIDTPRKLYDDGISSNYSGQVGPALSKHFKPWK